MTSPTVTEQSLTESPVAATAAAEVAPGFEIKATERYLLLNRTCKRIVVRDPVAGELMLPPLAERVVCGTRVAPFAKHLVPLRQRHQLSVRVYRQVKRRSRPLVAGVWLSMLVLLAVAATDVVVKGTLITGEALGASILLLGITSWVLTRASRSENRRRQAEQAADSEEGDIEFGLGGAYYDGNETLRRTKHIMTLLLVFAIGAVLPAIAIFVATDAKDFLIMDGGLRVVEGKESRLVSRLIQVTYTAVLGLFPALLYFQFDRERVGTIRGKWVRAIFRMDHRMETLADVNARYGDELAEASSYSTDSVRFLGGRNSPIIVATILVSLGWTLLVIRTESFDFAGATKVTALAQSAGAAAERASDAASSAAGSGTISPDAAIAANAAANQAAQDSQAAVQVAAASADVSVAPVPTAAASQDTSTQAGLDQAAQAAAGSAEAAAAAESAVQQPFFQLLVPTPNAATMAFLGAYFFGVYLILRCYFHGDLRPKIYNQITARLVTVVVLAYLLNVVVAKDSDGGEALWLLAFLAGVVPSTVLQRIGRLPASIAGKSTETAGIRGAFAQAFATPRPLTQIDGIDLQEASRLESEGIADVTSLAKADLVSVMVSTRVPVERLIDWIDQAVLVLLLDDGKDDGLNERVVRLRAVGVRTASGVLSMADADKEDEARKVVAEIVASKADGTDAMTLDQLVEEIYREPSMRRILQWYNSSVGHVDEPWQTIYEPPLDNDPLRGVDPSTNGHPSGDVRKPSTTAG